MFNPMFNPMDPDRLLAFYTYRIRSTAEDVVYVHAASQAEADHVIVKAIQAGEVARFHREPGTEEISLLGRVKP